MLYNLINICLSRFLKALLHAAVLICIPTLYIQAASQDVLSTRISVSAQEQDIRTVLSNIERMANVRFAYQANVLGVTEKVSIQAENETLLMVLDQIFKPIQVRYEVINRQIVLNRAEQKAERPAFAPISGKVLDEESQDPIVGATVVVKGSARGVLTNVNGQFTIEAKKGDVLVVSFVGYITQEVTVGDAPLTVALKAQTTSLGQITVVGTRSVKPRTDVSRPTPVDVVDAKELQGTGQVDLGQMVQFTSPSFNSSKNGINGVANYADPATLRGLSPDQSLVLINGKRRHQFSALNLNVTVGKGTVVTDMNAIPAMAIERIEVLRDGAAAQYGSDAIAGIINVGLKKSVKEGSFKSQYGLTKAGDGATYLGALNYGFELGKPNSYLNLTAHYSHSDGTDRSDPYTGRIYTKTSESIDKENQIRAQRGVWSATEPFSVTQYGSNQTQATQLFMNAGYPLKNDWFLYSFGGYSQKKVKAFGFFRIAEASNANSNPDLHPDGFTPELPGETLDYSAVVGLSRTVKKGWNMDFSTGYGFNSLDLWANNTTNPSMGAASPKDFYVGQSGFGQSTTEANLSKYMLGLWGTESVNIAFGGQFRIDHFILKRGDENSYKVGPLAATKNKAPGSSGRPGIAPDDEADETRSNLGVYADIESDITNRLLVATAVRYEYYSDFGGNLSGKLASRLKLTENFSVRASINKGFRAPSLQQIFNSVTTSTVQAGVIRQTKQLRSDDTRLKQIGIEDPKPETSWNYNVGITAKAGTKLLFTLDAFQIDIQDRIIISEALAVNSIAALKPLFVGIQEISFFTNHLNTQTRGIDFVTSFKHPFSAQTALNATLAFTFNQTKITKVKDTPSALQTGTTAPILIIDKISSALIETSQPTNKVLFSGGLSHKKLDLTLRASYFGEVTAWEKPTGGDYRSQTFGAKTIFDATLAYKVSPKISLAAGANNFTDVYPDKVLSNYASYFSGQTPYSRNVNQFGFNGAYYYVNTTINF